MSERIKRQNLNAIVAERIKQYILDNGLKMGDRLPTEQELADRFGVSRVSLRETTKALGFLGIIEASPRRGLAIGRVDMSRITDYLGFYLAISDFPLSQLLDTRIVIETGALPHVMQQMTNDPRSTSGLRSWLTTCFAAAPMANALRQTSLFTAVCWTRAASSRSWPFTTWSRSSSTVFVAAWPTATGRSPAGDIRNCSTCSGTAT